MAVTHVLLGLLAGGERHGYDLKRQYDQRFPAARPLAFGQVYTALESLQRRDLVRPGTTAKAGAAERTTFCITDAGRAELADWLREIEAPAHPGASTLQHKVTLALIAADEQVAADYLRAQRSAHLSRMRDYTRRLSDPAAPLAEVLAADYALTHLEADLRWIETAQARIHELAVEIEQGREGDPT